MKLLKNWQWREDAIIYNYPSEVIHQPYPFYWYRATGLQIDLVKQVSKYCGIVQDSNEFIPTPVVAVAEPIPTTEDIYVDHRSWLTLGEVPHDPIDQISTFVWGTRKVQLSFTPDGKLFERREWSYDQPTYTAQFSYSKKKDRYFANHYKNSEGVECKKIDTGWDWISGKPLIEKRYGKRK
jgi:hypothetical protein